jgi:hypothetical protein
MAESQNHNGVYKYVIVAVFWLLTLYIAWTQASSRVDSKVQEAFSQVDSRVEKAFEVRGEVSTARTDMLERRLERVEAKLDRVLELMAKK